MKCHGCVAACARFVFGNSTVQSIVVGTTGDGQKVLCGVTDGGALFRCKRAAVDLVVEYGYIDALLECLQCIAKLGCEG